MFKSLCIALRTYSRLPVPEVEWTAQSMQYAMCFFPLIGVVIGGAEFLWLVLSNAMQCSRILYGAVAAVIPLLITGAIHMDGFCDTVDALSSHQPREKMLEILKDSHAGAFAIIFAGVWMLVYFACFARAMTWKELWIIGFGFVLSRSLSGLAVVLFRNARQNGMLNAFSGTAARQPVLLTMVCCTVVSAAGMIVTGGLRGLIAVAANLLVWGYYRYLSYKKFGGITGDLAGWFLQLAELASAGCVALCAGWIG